MRKLQKKADAVSDVVEDMVEGLNAVSPVKTMTNSQDAEGDPIDSSKPADPRCETFPIPARTTFGNFPKHIDNKQERLAYQSWLLCRVVYEGIRWVAWISFMNASFAFLTKVVDKVALYLM